MASHGEDKVVAIMRPHAKELAQSGMKMITKTINDLAKVDKFFKEGSAKIVLDALVKNKCKN